MEKAWSDVEAVTTISDDTSKQVKTENNNEYFLPPELMEKIICHLDGRTLLNFKLLSKTCYALVENSMRFNSLWKNICQKELSKKYLSDLLYKQLKKYIPLYALSEIQCERLFKQWLRLQKPAFNVISIGHHHFVGIGGMHKIICHKLDVTISFPEYLYFFSVHKKWNSGKYVVREIYSKLTTPNTLTVLNPIYRTNAEDEYIIVPTTSFTICPLHKIVHGFNMPYPGPLFGLIMNCYTNKCCWIRYGGFECYSGVDSYIINDHLCQKVSKTLFTSVIHGIMIGQSDTNNIFIHGIFDGSCKQVESWLDDKYEGASKMFIYTNILFIGTNNGYLLAYRLRCWDDLIKLEENNLLLENKLISSPIVDLEILDYNEVLIVIISSHFSVHWMKIE